MEIKAIFIPDLAFPAKEGNFIFVYNPETKEFEMEINRELSYSVEAIMDDYWLVFKTELTEEFDDESSKVSRIGDVEQINKEELIELINRIY